MNVARVRKHKISAANVSADALRNALQDNRLTLVYQPKILLATGELVGVEALARWNDARHGAINPAIFIPLAEDHGLIDELTVWGLRTALDDWLGWRGQGLVTTLAFNISALSLQNLDFPDVVENLCRERGIAREHLTLELTESAGQQIIPLTDTLTRFRIKGIGIALDDFGTGYSSFAQLRRLPFTELKIDRCFVEDIIRKQDSRLITQSIVSLAHALGMTATAEGVQCHESLTLLATLGCDQAQADLISPPLRSDQLVAWSSQWRTGMPITRRPQL